MDIDAIIGETMNRSVNIPKKSAIYMWVYNHSGQTGRKGKEQQLRIPNSSLQSFLGVRRQAGANSHWLDIACGVSILRLWPQMNHYSLGFVFLLK